MAKIAKKGTQQKLITYDQVKSKIIEICGQKVILDSDVAELYGVETREINQAIKRNTIKFPMGYLTRLLHKNTTANENNTASAEGKQKNALSHIFQYAPGAFFCFPLHLQCYSRSRYVFLCNKRVNRVDC